MIQTAPPQYFALLFIRAEEGGHWHRHHLGDEPRAPQGVALGRTVRPRVNQGRWIVDCPSCPGAQLASPEVDRFFCVDCLNVAHGGQWLPVQWPEPQDRDAIEAALLARPAIANRSWHPGETIGTLLAENVMDGGLYDPDTGAVAGDIGADQQRTIAPAGRAELGPAVP